MRIAIVGIGDYGGRFAARLTNSGADVTLLATHAAFDLLEVLCDMCYMIEDDGTFLSIRPTAKIWVAFFKAVELLLMA